MAPIVCGVDRSTPARAAARLSAAMAARVGVPLVLTHALPDGRADRREAESWLSRLSRELELPDARLRVAVGPAARVLAAEDATLVAVGGADGTWLGGRVRDALVRRAPAPVAVVPAVRRLGGAEVLCGVRDWADAGTADLAVRWARALGLQLALIHVLPKAHDPGGSAAPLLDRPADHDAAHRLLDAIATAVSAADATWHVACGSARHVLAAEATAREAALLVIGAPTHGRVGGALNASPSTHLIHHTPRPLLVCPTSQRPSTDRALWPQPAHHLPEWHEALPIPARHPTMGT